IGESHVELAGDKRQYRSRQITNDRIFDAVEVRPVLLPVIRVSRHLNEFIRLELDELERACADRMLAHVARRDMAGIDRGIPRSQKPEKSRLRPIEVKGDLVIAIGAD